MLTSIAIYPSHVGVEAEAHQWAEQLNIPCVSTEDAGVDYLLLLTPDGLFLKKQGSKATPFSINFQSRRLSFRREHASLKKEALAKALGLKTRKPKTIVDATGGGGRDSFILATLGFEVTVLERSPIIHALLSDGIKRAKNDPALENIMSRLQLIHTCAMAWLKTEERPELIYLDPMFPPRKKTAQKKQDMLLFHALVGEDRDAGALLEIALATAKERVVVKRPRLAEPLGSPSYALTGSSSRFDVYII